MTVHPGLTCKAHTLSRGPSYREVPLLRNGGGRPDLHDFRPPARRIESRRSGCPSLPCPASQITKVAGGEMVSARMPTGMIALSSNLVGAPCFSRGSWTSGQRKSNSFRRTGFSPGFFEARAKALIEVQLFSATLEVSWTGSFDARLKTQPPRQGYAA
jgi:hypothetical protein